MGNQDHLGGFGFTCFFIDLVDPVRATWRLPILLFNPVKSKFSLPVRLPMLRSGVAEAWDEDNV